MSPEAARAAGRAAGGGSGAEATSPAPVRPGGPEPAPAAGGAPPAPEGEERRRADRRAAGRLAELSLPEFRRIVVTSFLFVVVVALFLWMVRGVLIAAILGVVIAVYLRPLYERVRRAVRSPALAALLTLAVVLLPVLGTLVYSYLELVGVARFLAAHDAEVTARIDEALRRVVFLGRASTSDAVGRWVMAASAYGAAIPGLLRRALGRISVATTIFLFTSFYIFTDAGRVVAYVRGKIPPRYADLAAAIETNVRGVLYGAIYATLLTQALKSAVIFALNETFGVPLAGVLAVLSFVIGFFPIVGSWSVYLPVAAWLLVFRDAPLQAGLMVAIGALVNTIFISMYLRPKLAADRSRVLNFYWMFVGLVTGVYTFGLAGILLGPILIGLLKAVVDAVTASASWRALSLDGDRAEADGAVGRGE
ncbi:MAG: AI-2E family transporter [Gemmatimonadaceae bacterium]